MKTNLCQHGCITNLCWKIYTSIIYCLNLANICILWFLNSSQGVIFGEKKIPFTSERIAWLWYIAVISTLHVQDDLHKNLRYLCPFALFTFPSRTTHVGSNQFQEIVSYKIVFFIKRKGCRRCLNININITNKTFTVICLMKYFTRGLKIFLYWNRFVIDHRWVGSLWLPEGIHSRTMRDLPGGIFSSVCWKSWQQIWQVWKSWQQIWQVWKLWEQIWPFSSGKSVPTVSASLDGLLRTLEINLSKYTQTYKVHADNNTELMLIPNRSFDQIFVHLLNLHVCKKVSTFQGNHCNHHLVAISPVLVSVALRRCRT